VEGKQVNANFKAAMDRLEKALKEFNAFTAQWGGLTPSLNANIKSDSYRIAVEFEAAQTDFYNLRNLAQSN
jgi:hypothetical protein